jgi:hypothetical protein
LKFNEIKIDEKYIKNESIPDFIPPPLGNSSVEDFNILSHIKLKEILGLFGNSKIPKIMK